MNPLDLVLIVLAAILVAYVFVAVTVRSIGQVRRAGAFFRDAVTAPFDQHFRESGRHRRLAQLEEEVGHALGINGPDDAAVREDIVRAARAAQYITLINQSLRKTVSQCLGTHWAVARGLGALEMAEAARHPLPARLRQRVIDLSELLSQYLERYPLLLESPELIRLQLGIRWIAPTCLTCPYFTVSVSEAPRVCPTATAVLRRPSARPTGIIDGEILDDCNEM